MNKGTTWKAAWLVAGVSASALAGCLDSSSGGGGQAEEHALNAEVSGLGPGEMVVDVNGEEVTIQEDGSLTLVESIEAGTDYEITVSSQPEDPMQSCEATPSSGTISDDQEVVISCLTPVKVTGEVTASGAEDETVTLTSGDTTSTGTVDENGVFTLEHHVADPYAVMRLDVAQGDWHFRSYLGSAAGLAGRESMPVGDDFNQLDEDVSGRVNLNHLNTSISAQLQWRNGGEAFDDHTELARANRELLTQDAAEIGGALRLVTEEGEPLPDYADDTFLAALDFPAALDWVDEIRSGEGSSASGESLVEGELAAEHPDSGQPAVDGHRQMQATSVTNATTLDESTSESISEATVSNAGFSSLPPEMFITGGHAWGYYSYAGKLDIVSSEAWLRESDGAMASGPHNLSNGDLHLSFSGHPDPIYTGTTTCSDGSGGQESCTVEWYYDSVIIRQVMDGLSGNIVEKEDEIRVEYPDNNHEPDTTRTEKTLVSLMTPGENVSLDESDIAGEIALSLPYERWKDDSEASATLVSDILDFDAGGTVDMNQEGTPMVWEVRSDGDLEMRPTDGGNEVYRGWLLSGNNDGEGYMLVDSDHSNDKSIVADRAMRRDPNLFFEASDLEGRWELYEGASVQYSGTWVLDYDRGASPNIAYLGDAADITDSEYRIEYNGDPQNPVFHLAACGTLDSNNNLVYTAPSSIGLPSSTTDPDCDFIYVERVWQIIRLEDDRLYHVEHQIRYLPDGSDWKQQLDQHTIRYFGDVGDAQI